MTVLTVAALCSGCERGDTVRHDETGEVAEPAPSEQRKAASPPSAKADQKAAMGATIDPPPIATDTNMVVKKSDITVAGEPACAFIVRYAGAQDQPVTWRGEACGALSVNFMTMRDLEAIGQSDKINDDARADIATLSKGRAFYIEGGFSSALYPLNAAGHIYSVALAD